MSLFKRKRDWLTEAQEIQQKRMGPDAVEKKRASMLRTYEEPVLPKLCKILFLLMLILTGAMLLVELNAYFRYTGERGVSHLLSNLTTSCLTIWSVCAAVLVLASFIGVRLNIQGYWKKKRESGITEQSGKERQRSRRAIRRLNATYRLYILVALIGFSVWLIFYLAVNPI